MGWGGKQLDDSREGFTERWGRDSRHGVGECGRAPRLDVEDRERRRRRPGEEKVPHGLRRHVQRPSAWSSELPIPPHAKDSGRRCKVPPATVSGVV